MADLKSIALWIATKVEDDPRHPGIAKDLGDGAGITRYGVTQRWHGKDVPPTFFTTMSNADAIACAVALYEGIADILHLNLVNDTDIAACVLSFALNANAGAAVRTLQQVLGANPDGILGMVTAAALNAKDPGPVATAYRTAWENYYRADVKAYPNKLVWLNGWLNRVKRVYPA